jgi:hypothetical protein
MVNYLNCVWSLMFLTVCYYKQRAINTLTSISFLPFIDRKNNQKWDYWAF